MAILKRRDHTLECELTSQDGIKRYKVAVLVCKNPACPCTVVSLELKESGDSVIQIVAIDIRTKAIADGDDGASVGPQLVAALTADDWKLLEDRFHEVKARNATVERTTTRVGPKIGRNDPCPCGTGKKYKKCCLSAAPNPTS